MKKIVSLVNYLNNKKLYKEAKFLEKISAPLIEGAGMFDMNDLQRDPFLMEKKHDFRKGLDEYGSVQEWYDSVKNLGQNTIIVQVDSSKMDSESKKVILDIKKRQGFDLANLANVRDFILKSLMTNEELLAKFPKLKNAIEESLSKVSSSLNLSDILIIINDVADLYGVSKKDSGIADFTSEYFAHDIGHIDSDGGIHSNFIEELSELLIDIASKYYIDETWIEDEDDIPFLSEAMRNLKNKKGAEYILTYLGYLFETFSDDNDLYPDIYSFILSGTLLKKLRNPLPTIVLSVEDGDKGDEVEYDISPYERRSVEKMVKQFEEKQLERIKNDVESGPLSQFKGRVLVF